MIDYAYVFSWLLLALTRRNNRHRGDEQADEATDL